MAKSSSIRPYDPVNKAANIKPEQSALKSFAMALQRAQDMSQLGSTGQPLEFQMPQVYKANPNIPEVQFQSWAERAKDPSFSNFLNLRKQDIYGISPVMQQR